MKNNSTMFLMSGTNFLCRYIRDYYLCPLPSFHSVGPDKEIVSDIRDINVRLFYMTNSYYLHFLQCFV